MRHKNGQNAEQLKWQEMNVDRIHQESGSTMEKMDKDVLQARDELAATSNQQEHVYKDEANMGDATHERAMPARSPFNLECLAHMESCGRAGDSQLDSQLHDDIDNNIMADDEIQLDRSQSAKTKLN